jgi:3'-phosphoadenosine 5'-phosphosulfate sulfotransferase (PAPS reductase)/FAD synthetase
MLKIEPTIAYFQTLPDDAVLHVGLRADEEIRRGIFGEDMNIKFDMRDWGWKEADVWRYLKSRNVTIPNRTDCAVCPYQRLEEWHALWRDHPDQFQAGVDIEKRHGHTFRSAQRDTWPASLEELGKAFASGRQLRKSSRGTTCRVCSL